MKKKIIIPIVIVTAFLVLIGIALVIYPTIEFQKDGKLIRCSYSEHISKYEENPSYDETFFYYEERDISIRNFEWKKFWFFHVIIMEYEEGNLGDTQFILGEEYIENFLENAEITDNPNNIDLAKLIEGKTCIPDNKRYFGNDYETSICYVLDGRHEAMYLFYIDDMLVIQVGNSDEGPKFIAYK